MSTLTDFTFTDDEAPDFAPPHTEPSTDLACEVCNRPLVYGGRGRKPRFCDDHKPARSAGIPRGSSDVAQALAVMDGMYTMLSMLLMAASPNALHAWREQVPTLQERNAVFFAADKNLCKSVNKIGSKGGKTAFISSNVIAVAPVVAIAAADMWQRTAVRAQQKAQQRAEQTEPVPPGYIDPDAAFRR